jgi:hypothetical protein
MELAFFPMVFLGDRARAEEAPAGACPLCSLAGVANR